jgi:hypothetical protein
MLSLDRACCRVLSLEGLLYAASSSGSSPVACDQFRLRTPPQGGMDTTKARAWTGAMTRTAPPWAATGGAQIPLLPFAAFSWGVRPGGPRSGSAGLGCDARTSICFSQRRHPVSRLPRLLFVHFSTSSTTAIAALPACLHMSICFKAHRSRPQRSLVIAAGFSRFASFSRLLPLMQSSTLALSRPLSPAPSSRIACHARDHKLSAAKRNVAGRPRRGCSRVGLLLGLP